MNEKQERLIKIRAILKRKKIADDNLVLVTVNGHDGDDIEVIPENESISYPITLVPKSIIEEYLKFDIQREYIRGLLKPYLKAMHDTYTDMGW